MSHTRFGDADAAPAMNCANRGLDQIGHLASAAECVDDFVCVSFHEQGIMRYSQQSQEQSCDIRFCDIRTGGVYGRMDIESIKARAESLGVKQADIARAIGIDQDKLSKMFGGKRQLKAAEAALINAYLDKAEDGDPDFVDKSRDYLPVQILPSFGGMGGGGSGEGDREIGLVPRRLIEDELRAKPADFLLIDTRGDSAEPEFFHGDQILIDKRDRNPVQPGAFCLWDGDGYVIKVVERIPQRKGWYRVFSNNSKYQPAEMSEEDVTIMGRPVWFARRL